MRSKLSLLTVLAVLAAAVAVVANVGLAQGQSSAYCEGITATTGTATNVTDTAAQLNGTVNPGGKSGIQYRFDYGTSTSYGSSTTPKGVTGNTPQNVTELLSGLTPNTTYHFRVVAINTASNPDTSCTGSDATFTTTNTGQPMTGPIVATGPADQVTATSARITGAIIPGASAVQYAFAYGTSTSYDKATTLRSLPAGQSGVAVSEPISGLTPGTTYHFQLVAVNAGGQTGTGGDKTFTTITATTGKARPRSVTGKVKPKRDTTKPYKYAVSGQIVLPAGVSRVTAGAAQASACSGKVRIRIKQGRKVRGKGTANVRSNCRYSKKVKAKAKGTRGKLKVSVRFLGNSQLKQRAGRTRTVYFGPRKS